MSLLILIVALVAADPQPTPAPPRGEKSVLVKHTTLPPAETLRRRRGCR